MTYSCGLIGSNLLILYLGVRKVLIYIKEVLDLDNSPKKMKTEKSEKQKEV